MTRVTIKTHVEHLKSWDVDEIIQHIKEDMEVYFDGKIHVRVSWDDGWIQLTSEGKPVEYSKPPKDVLL